MSLYKLTPKQVQNLRALIMDATIKGNAAQAIVDLIKALEHPVVKAKKSDLHSKHNDSKKHSTNKP